MRCLLRRGSRDALARLQRLGTPAATVALLRNTAHGRAAGIECLLLRKAKERRFGKFWVFPGGALEPQDEVFHTDDTRGMDVLASAANAAVRELAEESEQHVDARTLTFFSHWTPPPAERERGKVFSTFFFAAAQPQPDAQSAQSVQVDRSEISAHQWISPDDALSCHAAGGLPLLPPTFMTLSMLAQHRGKRVDAALAAIAGADPIVYETRAARLADGRTAFMWEGDAGWATSDADARGSKRHRLIASHDPTSTKDESVAAGLAQGTVTLAFDGDGVVHKKGVAR
mmetsp:Transcript_7100/g.18402  ORF Transcript_7100/g.18402 Transcript_7100/m.18402 type:complete len:286 (+) Transcript_7100:25-882(+)